MCPGKSFGVKDPGEVKELKRKSPLDLKGLGAISGVSSIALWHDSSMDGVSTTTRRGEERAAFATLAFGETGVEDERCIGKAQLDCCLISYRGLCGAVVQFSATGECALDIDSESLGYGSISGGVRSSARGAARREARGETLGEEEGRRV